MGAYTVRWGDTLSGLALTAGVPTEAMAAANGLDPDGVLLAGTVLKLPTGAPTPPRADEPAPAPIVPAADPQPTEQRLDSGTVASIAAQQGVPGSLATAIAYQESGFNNAMVSDANARGVMQVMPGTWTWIQQNLAPRQLDPSSAADNVAAGSLYMKHLLEETGGDESMAIAGYYQGLGSVQSQGMLPETRRYVANVQALRSRFGG
jgi:soluble lytic murein transglycosylase-like protein